MKKNLNEDNQQPTQFPYYPPQTFPLNFRILFRKSWFVENGGGNWQRDKVAGSNYPPW